MRVKTVLWVAVLAMVGLCTGCPDKKPVDDNGNNGGKAVINPALANLLIQPDPAADLGYRIGWASPIQLDPGQKITSVTVVGDMIIIIEDPNNIVTALRASDGELMWKKILGSRLESLFPPSRDKKQLFIHSADRFWTLETKNGDVESVATMESSVRSAATYSPETRLAVLNGSDGTVFAHSTVSNFARWKYKLASNTSQSPVFAGQDVFVVDEGGTYAMIETSTGTPIWRNRTLGPVTAAPRVQGSEVIVASEDGKLYALNRTTGKDTWVYIDAGQPLSATPFALGRVIIQPLLPKSGLIALDAINGKELWKADVRATPIMARQKDVLLHNDSEIFAVSIADGKLLTKAKTKKLMAVKPIDDKGAILLVSPAGRLLRLNPN